jgi:hypothetical protein
MTEELSEVSAATRNPMPARPSIPVLPQRAHTLDVSSARRRACEHHQLIAKSQAAIEDFGRKG